MTRLRRDRVPLEWADARDVLESKLVAIEEVIDRGVRAAEQFRDVRTFDLDTAVMPVDVEVTGITTPLAVLLLRAVQIPRSSDGVVVSGAAVSWSWREGKLRVHAIAGLSGTYSVSLMVVD